jgi:hypothetical protein
MRENDVPYVPSVAGGSLHLINQRLSVMSVEDMIKWAASLREFEGRLWVYSNFSKGSPLLFRLLETLDLNLNIVCVDDLFPTRLELEFRGWIKTHFNLNNRTLSIVRDPSMRPQDVGLLVERAIVESGARAFMFGPENDQKMNSRILDVPTAGMEVWQFRPFSRFSQTEIMHAHEQFCLPYAPPEADSDLDFRPGGNSTPIE